MYTLSIKTTNNNHLHNFQNTVVVNDILDVINLGHTLVSKVYDENGFALIAKRGCEIYDYVYLDFEQHLAYTLFMYHNGYRTDWDEQQRTEFLVSRFHYVMGLTIPIWSQLCAAYVEYTEDRTGVLSTHYRLWDILLQWTNTYWFIIHSISVGLFGVPASKEVFIETLKGRYNPEPEPDDYHERYSR